MRRIDREVTDLTEILKIIDAAKILHLGMMEQENPHYEELCRRFLADAKDFSEENIRKSGITRRFANNGEFDDCVDEIRQALKELVYE